CVRTDHPVAACMAAQYAGWQIQAEPKFFAMGSGPMRAAAGKEDLFDRIGFRERPAVAVGVLETSSLPPLSLADRLASDCGVAVERLTLLMAATSSLAGTVQVVARSVETALHKLHELGFDLAQVVSGWGTAPLPPVAENDLAAIGRTNDAVLYGGQVTLWVDADDDELVHLGPRVPSCSSPDYGRPFGVLFEQYERDFYRIDPLLFSPAVVTLINTRTGRTRRYGELRPDVLEQSFA
ncbi:MAG: methenyltetrahydromethanopterin cyclohydrolase, partial [Pirellulaceae bacterium]|nr:methenyltetrahydromethanopterin cyclohydrolase [Pirellulaceae bacterium]